jgi:hypothetical protein
MKMLKSIFHNLDLDLGGSRFSYWFKGSRVPWNTFATIMKVLTFIPSGDYLVVEGVGSGNSGTPIPEILARSAAAGKTSHLNRA